MFKFSLSVFFSQKKKMLVLHYQKHYEREAPIVKEDDSISLDLLLGFGRVTEEDIL